MFIEFTPAKFPPVRIHAKEMWEGGRGHYNPVRIHPGQTPSRTYEQRICERGVRALLEVTPVKLPVEHRYIHAKEMNAGDINPTAPGLFCHPPAAAGGGGER